MKLKNIRVNEFQSIRDSNEFATNDITCLVGKNEAGKTAILQAIYRLNPIIGTEGNFDVVNDYPRSDVEDYRFKVDNEKRTPAIVIEAIFEIENDDITQLIADYEENVLTSRTLKLSKGYENQINFELNCNFKNFVKSLTSKDEIPKDLCTNLDKCKNVDELIEILTDHEQTTEVSRIKSILTEIKKQGFSKYIYLTYIKSSVPQFLFFDEYYQMKGFENIEALKQRKASNNLLQSDHPMLGLINLARLNLDELLNPQRTQELKNKLQGAGNHLSKKVLKYWSQNKHLRMEFDVRPGMPGDPDGMTSGTNIWAEVYDSRHSVSTSLGSRSRGFVWFFSFLSWYSQVQRENQNLILLLDEPGLFLHAKAQEDLLRYFEEELKGNHQLVFTTHSPFMVDPKHFERIRIVQDKGIDTLDRLPENEEGTKVLTDVLEATSDSLFPLQGALGYEIHQSLFVGPNSLVVEGVSDLLIIQTMNDVLRENGLESLSNKWTITPVGGSDKVPTFISLLGSQKGLNIATLIDIQKKDKQVIENLYKKKLLKKNQVLTFGVFTNSEEADIEDMFENEFYLDLVNSEYADSLKNKIKLDDLNNSIPRIGVRLEKYFEENPMKNKVSFNHYRPARFFAENIISIKKSISEGILKRFEEAFKKLNSLVKK